MEDGGVAGRVLRELGLETDRVREMIQRVGGEGHDESGKIELAPDTQLVLEYAIEEARKMGHHYIGTEHLLLGPRPSLRQPSPAASRNPRPPWWTSLPPI